MALSQKDLEYFKKKLEEQKTLTEVQLSSFAKRDSDFSEDWETKYPDFGAGGKLEEEISEEEKYMAELPVEHILELKLKDINLALEKIKNGSYGICEVCQKEIPKERLELMPEARYCLECQKKQ